MMANKLNKSTALKVEADLADRRKKAGLAS
jgi:hypothetical protein